MTWAKIDDRANENEKQLAAGPAACWLWACGLMYCNRQAKKTGLIPKVMVRQKMLYPGLGTTHAKKLVDVGLWHDVGDHYEVHDYGHWNGEKKPERDTDDEVSPALSEARAAAGRAGGRRSGEARRQRSNEANRSNLLQANEANEPKQDASRAQPRVGARTAARGIHPTPPHPNPDLPDDASPKDLKGRPDESPPGGAAGIPTVIRCLDDALKVPIEDRANRVLSEPHIADWACPHLWPEVRQVAAKLHEAAELAAPKLGHYARDAGVRVIVEAFAAGYSLDELLAVASRIPGGSWWRELTQKGKRPGLSWVSLEVIRREASALPSARPVNPAVRAAAKRAQQRIAQ